MILISGGLGFIGSHTARALLDLGQACLLTRHRRAHVPDFLEEELGRRIVIEQLDWTDTASVLQLGKRHEITAIIHLAAPAVPPDRISYADGTTHALLNALRAGREWGVGRVAIASSIGLYIGVTEAPFRDPEDALLGGVRRLASRPNRGRGRGDEGALRIYLRRLPPSAPDGADRLPLPCRGVAAQGDRARSTRAPAVPRPTERLTTRWPRAPRRLLMLRRLL
jgi:hypothetical protein